MKIAICDDEPQALAHLAALLAEYDPGIQVDAFSAAADLHRSAQTVTYDAVLLDIEMESPNGYEIALRLAREEPHPIILFVTNSASYAVQGYGLALRYLLKPLTIETLSDAMDAVRQELRCSRLTVTLEGISHVFNVHDIVYAEVINHHVTLHTTAGSFSFRATLKDLTGQLPGRWFCAPHQSYVVNLLHVRTVSAQEVILTDGTRIPISRRRQREFLQGFHRFLGV